MNLAHAEVATLDPTTMRTLCEEYMANNYIDPETSERLGVKRGLRAMRPGGAAGQGGTTINVASVAATTAFPALPVYSATNSPACGPTMVTPKVRSLSGTVRTFTKQ